MTRKKAHDSDSVSDPSDRDFDSDDSLKEKKTKKKSPPKKMKLAKEQVLKTKTPRRPSPKKKKKQEEDEEPVNLDDPDEDNQHKGLVEEYDDEDLLNISVPELPEHVMQVEGGARLIITDIVVNNFKSYYGRKRIGPFHHSFTSIIGPNGSGKSNVIDALLFVFGYKASKIRSKKVSVLIHSSAGRDDCESCSVKIYFQKIIDDKIDPKIKPPPPSTYKVVPGTNFSVSRIAKKDNSSHYEMDDKKVSFKEVAVKLKAQGIDLVHNRFLILQGEVEQIAMMKPKAEKGGEDGMLEYLEDIIGSSRYKVPIERLATKLEKIQIERSHQCTKTGHIQKEYDQLKEPMNQALSYMSMENEVLALNAKMKLHAKYTAENVLDSLEPERLKIEDQLAQAKANLQSIVDRLNDKKKSIEKLTKELGKAEADIHRTSSELELLEQRDKKRMNDLERVQDEMKRLNDEIAKQKEKLAEAEAAPEAARREIQTLTVKLDELNDEFSTSSALYDEVHPKFTKKTQPDREKKQELEEEYSVVAQRLADSDAKLKIAQTSLDRLVEEYEKKKAQLEEVERVLEANKKDMDKNKAIRDESTAAREEREKEIVKLRGECDVFVGRLQEIEKRKKELEPFLNDKQQEATQKHKMNQISRILNDARMKGQMKGYIGRIGDLGSIEAKYDVAISNNYGGNLDLQLVEDAAAVKEGSALLKRNDLRTRFVDNTRLKKNYHHMKQVEAEKDKNIPNRPPRLFNLIECEEKYKLAFYFVVGSAYVVPTIEEANQLFKRLIAEKCRTTIVSMDGNMINKDGSFTGGGMVRRGKIGTGPKVARAESTYDPAAAERHLKAVEEFAKLVEEEGPLHNEKMLLEQQIASISPQSHALKERIERINVALKASRERHRMYEERRAEKEGEMLKVKVDEKDLEARRKEIEQLKTERDKNKEESAECQAKMSEVQKEIDRVFNKMVKKHEKARDDAQAQIVEVEKALAKQAAVINGAEREIGKQTKRLRDVNKDVDNKRGKLSFFSKDADMFMKGKMEKKQELDAHRKRREEKKAKLEDAHVVCGNLDSEEVLLVRQAKLFEESVAAMKGRMQVLQKSIDSYDKTAEEEAMHNITAALAEIPEPMRPKLPPSTFLMEGDSDSDEEYEEYMSSPSKARRRAARESKKAAKKEEKRGKKEAKRRRMIVEEDEEEAQAMEADDEAAASPEADENGEGRGEGGGAEIPESERSAQGRGGGLAEMPDTPASPEPLPENGVYRRRERGEDKENRERREESGESGQEGEENGVAEGAEEDPAEAANGDDTAAPAAPSPAPSATASTAAATEAAESDSDEEETDEQREARAARRLRRKREMKQQAEEALMSGKIPNWTSHHVLNMDTLTIKSQIEDLNKRIASAKRALRPHVVEDFKRKVLRYAHESATLNEIRGRYDAHRDKMEGLKKLRLADFTGGFKSISTALRELYQMITLGGDASLEVKDNVDPFLDGVQFMVRPPKKSWKQIENLSGGEKTLSSLALVFALHKYRPTPLYVMDEIDAALDFRNVSIIGHYIKDRTKNAQFIIISLRNNMFELADRLIGIYKVRDCTHNVVIDPKKVMDETAEQRSGLKKVRKLVESNVIHCQTGVGYGHPGT